jgi:hypothetical protein
MAFELEKKFAMISMTKVETGAHLIASSSNKGGTALVATSSTTIPV